MRERLRSVPAPLGALLLAAAVLGIAWALVLPAWQSPDENSHYGYVQSLVDGPGLPGVADHPLFSTEQGLAADAVNADQMAAALQARAEWSRDFYERWKDTEARITAEQRSDGGGLNPARSNPPLAYLAYSVPYLVNTSAGPFDRLVWMRVLGVLWLLVTVAATWLLAGEVFGPRPSLQLAAAALPALSPMTGFISASVSPDGLMFATWSLAFWLGARMLLRGLTPARAVTFFLAVGAACWVKATSYALVPAALFALGLAVWRTRPAGLGAWLRGAVPGLATLAAVVGSWLVLARLLARPASAQLSAAATTSGLDVRELASYLWQYYLPKLWFMQDFFPSVPMTVPVYDVLLEGAWARFGWLEVRFPEGVYIVLLVLTVGVSIAAIVSLRQAWARVDRGLLAFFAIAMVTLFVGLHWQEYQLVMGGSGPIMQGRYILPLVALAGLVLAAALRLVPVARRGTVVGLVVGGLFALSAFSLGLTLERFHA